MPVMLTLDLRRAGPLDLEEILEGLVERGVRQLAGDAARVRRVAQRCDECQVRRLGLGALCPPELEELEAVAVALIDDGGRGVAVVEDVGHAAHELAELLLDLVPGSDVGPALLFRNGRVGRCSCGKARRGGKRLHVVKRDALNRRWTRLEEVVLYSVRQELLDELDAVGLVDG
eukprot:scaffold97831_cov40-Phaeocystis_antarctica.AAC.1